MLLSHIKVSTHLPPTRAAICGSSFTEASATAMATDPRHGSLDFAIYSLWSLYGGGEGWAQDNPCRRREFLAI